MEILQKLASQPRKIPAGRHTADWAGQNVVKHQRGHAEFRQRSAEGLLDGAIHTTAHEHPAAFYIDRFSMFVRGGVYRDRKSTRLNSSHVSLADALSCCKRI